MSTVHDHIMENSNDGNLLEIIDLAHSLRQEHLYITNEQHTFRNLNETLIKNSSNVAQVTTQLFIIGNNNFTSATGTIL